MKARMAPVIALFVASTLSGTSGTAKNTSYNLPFVSHGEGPQFFLDFSSFQGADERTFVEFYFQVGYGELQFIKHNGRFRAMYDLELSIEDESGKIVEHYKNRDIVDLETYGETQSRTRARVSLAAFTFDPNRYIVKAVLTDVETTHSTQIVEAFEAQPFPSSKTTVSDLQFSQKIEAAREGDPYVKNQRYIEPNPIRAFARSMTDNVCLYFEVYNLKFGEGCDKSSYTTHFIFQDSSGKTLAKLKRVTDKPGTTSAHSIRFPIEHFVEGEHLLTVQIKDNDTGEIAETTKSFSVTSSSVLLSEYGNREIVW